MNKKQPKFFQKSSKIVIKLPKILIKKNDKVLVLSGKDRGKTGKVEKVLRRNGKVIIPGIAIVKKSTKPTKKNSKGGIISMPSPVHISNVALICPKCNKKAKARLKKVSGKKERICKVCKEQI